MHEFLGPDEDSMYKQDKELALEKSKALKTKLLSNGLLRVKFG
jgi:hypothetical protein